MYDIAVVGGGPAGIMAAVTASENSNVILLEKNSHLASKLLLSGGGRCNITNLKPTKKLLNQYDSKNFLKHSFYSFTNDDLFSFFDIPFHEEDSNRIFPDDGALKVLEVLTYKLKDVSIRYNFEVKSIQDHFLINNEIKAQKMIIATGGATYPQTGTSIDNYSLTSQTLTPIKYGLSPLMCSHDVPSGLRLSDVVISYKKNKIRGDILFTPNTITGPAVLDLSNILSKSITYNLLEGEVSFKEIVNIDLIPDLAHNDLSKLFKKEFRGKTLIKNYLKKFLVNNFIEFFLKKAGIDLNTQLSQIKKKDKNRLIEYLKSFPLEVTSFHGDLAKVTIGGVDLKYINPKTMESTLTPGLYFAGEVLDVHGPTGGYNLKIAFSTGYLAGLSASSKSL